MLFSLFFTIRTFYQPISWEIQYFIDNTILQRTYIVGNPGDSPSDVPISFTPPTSQFAKFFHISQVGSLRPIDADFSIVIPKIAANARIIANVDASNEQVYTQKLKEGVAHVAGTYFPGGGKHIFLFAHSTDYIWNIGTQNAVFYLLYKLQPGDEVNLFYKGHRYVYVTEGSMIVDPSEVEYITRQTDGEFLTLQTCWPPGTTAKRLLIFARPQID